MSPLDRRQFMTRTLAGLAAAGTGGAGALTAGGIAAGASTLSSGEEVSRDGLLDEVPFDGKHQAGILEPAQSQVTFLALDSIAPNRPKLLSAVQVLSARARQLTQGGTSLVLPREEPPVDTGILGPVVTPDGLTITIGFGASLFDDRYGLAAAKPANLIEMPPFPTDALDLTRSHGDLMVQIGANHRDTVVHAVRELLRTVRGSLQVRWAMDGFSAERRGPNPHSSTRNLFAFRDGTANPDVTDDQLMRQLVWVDGNGEPAWTTGGTYQVVRVIRMHVEFWDRVGIAEQEAMIGRNRTTGAPLGGTNEFEDPRLDLDPKGDRIPLDSHIRLANPRTPKSAAERILRRGFNYDRGIDSAGALDQGLLFSAFNRNPATQFAVIQNRLSDEPMIDYITPVGGGYFFVPPGTGGKLGFVGEGLFGSI